MNSRTRDKAGLTPKMRLILSALADGEMALHALCKLTGGTKQATYSTLRAMMRAKLVHRIRYGVYAATKR